MRVIDETRIELITEKLFPQIVLLCILPPLSIKISYEYLILNKHLSFARKLFDNLIIISSIIYLAICMLDATKIFNKQKPGIVLNNLGIIDRCSSNAVGFIPWHDILSITICQSHKYSQNQLIINVKEPQKHIENGGNYCQIIISPDWLHVNFAELVTIFKQYLVKYGETELAEPWNIIDDA